MSDAPAAPTLGERKTQQAIERIKTKIADSDERGIRAAEPLSVGLRVDLDVALALIESQSAEIAFWKAQAEASTRPLSEFKEEFRALTAANARNARLSEALREIRLVAGIHSSGEALDICLIADAALDAQPEQGVE